MAHGYSGTETEPGQGGSGSREPDTSTEDPGLAATAALLATRASSEDPGLAATAALLATRASTGQNFAGHARGVLQVEETMAGNLQLRTRAGPARGVEATLPEEGERVGRFVILRELGRGAMGVVFAGYDEELARRVALKLLHFGPQVDASAGRSQLLREAQALARLTHPNVVAVYEAGVWRGSVYVAMEYVQGVDLQVWLAAEVRPWREVLGVLRQAGEGLLAAHRSGLVHRDFKPSNVLVGDDGRARVADFGLAAGRGEVVQQGLTTSTPSLLTSTIAGEGALVGTPAYMAPEQIRRAEATALSDQFAFCVTLHEALYGERPFTAPDFAGLAAAIEHEEPRTPASKRPVPVWLGPLLLRGLAKDPARRFPSLAELLAELARDPEAERARRRRLALQLLATVTLTVLVVAGGIRMYGALVRQAAERRADARLEQLREQLTTARDQGDEGQADRLLAAFAQYPDNRGTAAVSRAYRERAAELVDPTAAVDAFAGAYLTATDRDDEIAALRGLIPRLVAAGRHIAAGEALATLDRRAPELAADPELALARRTSALRSRDLRAAADALAGLAEHDPARTYEDVLRNMSYATSVPAARLGASGRPRATISVADLDGDGRGELGTLAAQGLGWFALSEANAELRSLGTLRGEPGDEQIQLLPHTLTGSPMAVISGSAADLLAVDRPHRLVELAADGSVVTRLAWTDSRLCRPVVTDLDGDGQTELYVGSGAYARQLSRIDRGPDGRWRRSSVLPQIDRIQSDVNAIAAGDLDGDGREELVVAMGPWRAFDLRVVQAGQGGGARQIARRTVGTVKAMDLVRVGKEIWIAAVKRDEYASATRFSTAAPHGPPAGIYLFALREGALVEVGFFATSNEPELEAYDHPLLVADLDGDGQDDLVAGAAARGDREMHIAVLRQHAGGFLPPLLIRGLEAQAAIELDGDPASELLVGGLREEHAQHFALGLGDELLAPLPALRSEPRPPPASVEDPTLAAAWGHAEEMVAVGLPQRSAVELAGLASLAGHVREDLLLRSGELHALAGDHAAAADRFIAAAERPDLADQALAGAIRSRRALGEIAAEAALVARRAALPDLAAAERRAAELELERLRRATAPRPVVAMGFDRPLDPRFQIHDPLALTRAPDSGGLHLRSGPDELLASLPLRHDGGTFGMSVEIEVERAEWGSSIAVVLAGAEPHVYLTMHGEGSVEAPGFRHDTAFEAIWIPKIPIGRIRLDHTIYPELALETYTLTVPGAPTRQLTGSRAAPPGPGTMTLELRAASKSPNLVAGAWIHRIELRGLELAGTPTPDPARELARAIVEGELATALALLPTTEALAPGDLRLLWRSELLARLDDLDGAAEALRRGLHVPKDSPFHRAFKLHLHSSDGPWHMVAARVLGPHLVQELYDVTALSHPWRPGAVGDALARLAQWSREPDPATDRERLLEQALALTIRGEAWRRFGRPELARPDLDAAAAIMERPSVEIPRQLRDELQQRRLELAARTGERALATELMTAMLGEALSPDIRLERLRGREELRALLRPEDWAALERLTRE